MLVAVPSVFAATRIQAGNVLKITVSGHSEFSGEYRILQDGTTEYPLLAGIPLDGLTADDVKELLRSVLLRFELEPDIFVIISEQMVIKFQVFGAVKRPGEFEAEGSINLQQALEMAGGIDEDGDYSHIRIMRLQDDRRVDIVVDLKTFFRQDSLVLPPEIQDRDIIIVPRQTAELTVRILGAVYAPGFYVVEPGDDLYDIILKAGGQKSEADNRRVMHINRIGGKPERKIVDLHKIIQSGHYEDLPLVSYGDIIIVPDKAEWRDFWLWLTRWREIAYFLTSLIIIDRYINE
jgi:polysaccharide export outer membrane protein